MRRVRATKGFLIGDKDVPVASNLMIQGQQL
jgi:hypothetical protein